MAHPEDPGGTRIGYDERQRAIDALGEHFAQGRLDLQELEQRVSRAAEARTVNDVMSLFADLPEPHPVLPPTAAVRSQPVRQRAQPGYPEPYSSERYKVVAGLLQIFLPFGIGRFYTGHTRMAVAQLLLCFLGVGILWSFIDGIVLLATDSTDAEGRRLRS